jgi:Na+/H+-dicarboxylate symporter/ABC-type amino acid transport substrate-binding protein
MSFTNQILVGLGAGIAVGLFFGEYAGALEWAADGFVKLLQMTVLPYVTVSIAASLGRLGQDEAKALGVRVGAVLAGLWLVALTFALLIPLTFPHATNASFFSTTLVERRASFSFIDLYIPSNPFHSLANNIVPAVVIFSIVLGVALIGVERRQVLIDVLQTSADALARATRLVSKLTPYGLFAIAATAAGTMSLEQVERLQIYLIAYVAVALLVSLWVLPGLVAALTPIRVRDIFSHTRNALITAFVAGDLFIVLPVLIDASKALVLEQRPGDTRSAALPDAIVPASFNFPHTGKLLSLSFVLFAGWFADAIIPVSDYPRLAFAGLVTFFGSLNAAVPFLLDTFRIPADTFQLFLASGVVNSRFGTLVAAVHTVTVALLGTCAMTGTLTWERRRIVRYLLVTGVLTIAVVGGARVLFATVLEQTYTRDKVLAAMHLVQEPVPAVVHRAGPSRAPEPLDGRSQLDLIRARGVLRVGYTADALPFAFFNGRGELVGFDIELAHRLARELNLRLEFVPADRQRLAGQLDGGEYDLVMSGIAVTTDRAGEVLFSNAYLDETLAFVVRDEAREAFMSWAEIEGRARLRLAVPDIPYYITAMKRRLPRAELRVFPDVSQLFPAPPDVDAILLPAERGSAWTLLHPQYAVVVPEPGLSKVPLAWPIARRDQALASFVNTWIELKRRDGTLDAVYRYWILGRDAAPHHPRWSILRDVLHWID